MQLYRVYIYYSAIATKYWKGYNLSSARVVKTSYMMQLSQPVCVVSKSNDYVMSEGRRQGMYMYLCMCRAL